MLICWFNLEMTNLMWYSIVVKHQHSLKKSSDRWVLIVSVLDENKNKIKPQREIPEDTSTLIVKMNFEPSSARCLLVTQIHQNHIIIQWQKMYYTLFYNDIIAQKLLAWKKNTHSSNSRGCQFPACVKTSQIFQTNVGGSSKLPVLLIAAVIIHLYQFCINYWFIPIWKHFYFSTQTYKL